MNLLITLQANQSAEEVEPLYQELLELNLPAEPPIPVVQSNSPAKGELISSLGVLAIAVGSGGALTMALSKDGFLSQLARVLEKYISREMHIEVEDPSGKKFRISGPPAQIRKLLEKTLK